MSRVIKFRAWIEWHDGTTTMLPDALPTLEDLMSSDNVTVLQYTGRNDANNNEIWQGSIIADHVGVGVVEYCDRHAAFRVNYQNGQCKWFYDYILNGEADSIEVIGEVHQDPALLKIHQLNDKEEK